jgi:hypothetical protein
MFGIEYLTVGGYIGDGYVLCRECGEKAHAAGEDVNDYSVATLEAEWGDEGLTCDQCDAVIVDAPEPDFEVENHGTIYLLRPKTDAARTWIEENIGEDAQTFGEAVVVEHRYIADIVAGIREEGLRVI